MDPSEKTPSKGLLHSTFGALDSPFRRIQNCSTPPSRLKRIKNPFESVISENLHFFSPTVFTKVSMSETDQAFKWTIDELSEIKPADIDEDTTHQYETHEHDSALESFAQSRIDTFFSLKEIVPSPYTHIKQSPLLKEVFNTPSPKLMPKSCDNSAQTVLTLPPKLPEHIEDLLAPYFSYTQNQQCGEMSTNGSLYRKLFDYNIDTESNQSSPAKSLNLNLSPIRYSSPQISPCGVDDNRRNFNSPHCNNGIEMNNCTLSPICKGVDKKSTSRLNNTNHMSVDESIGCVPDFTDVALYNKSVIELDRTKSPIAEHLSDSTVHWDMEYKELLSPNGDTSTNEMDVSTSNTPKSKIFISQRKNLSNSFLIEYESDDDDAYKIVNVHPVKSFNCRSDMTDAGYQTGCSTVSLDSSSWTNTHLFASTPTKRLLKH